MLIVQASLKLSSIDDHNMFKVQATAKSISYIFWRERVGAKLIVCGKLGCLGGFFQLKNGQPKKCVPFRK